jgi:hypothetical protein
MFNQSCTLATVCATASTIKNYGTLSEELLRGSHHNQVNQTLAYTYAQDFRQATITEHQNIGLEFEGGWTSKSCVTISLPQGLLLRLP